MRLPNPRRQARPGAALVETAFIAIILFSFMFAIFEFGRYMMVKQIIENAAREGARTAIVTATSYITPATATANVQAVITQKLANQNVKNLTVQVYLANDSGTNIGLWTDGVFSSNIVVQIDADLPILFPTFGFLPKNGAYPNSAHITPKSMMQFEAN